MSAQHIPRLRFIQTLIVCSIPMLFALHGCESNTDQRLADAREMVRHRQAAPSASGMTPSPTAGPAPTATGVAPTPQIDGGHALPGGPAAAPAPDQPASGSGLPTYPGASRVGTGAGADPVLDDGLITEMLETRDPVDAVIDFYSKRMVSSDVRLKTTRTDDRLDGNRVVRLSLPQPDGGLQTVEAREGAGKTTIQLLSMKGKTTKTVPNSIPGVDPLAQESPRTVPRSSRATNPVPGDISAPPVDIPPLHSSPGR